MSAQLAARGAPGRECLLHFFPKHRQLAGNLTGSALATIECEASP